MIPRKYSVLLTWFHTNDLLAPLSFMKRGRTFCYSWFESKSSSVAKEKYSACFWCMLPSEEGTEYCSFNNTNIFFSHAKSQTFLMAAVWVTFNRSTASQAQKMLPVCLQLCFTVLWFIQPHLKHPLPGPEVDGETLHLTFVHLHGVEQLEQFHSAMPIKHMVFSDDSGDGRATWITPHCSGFPFPRRMRGDARTVLLQEEHLWCRERGLIQTMELSTGLTAYGNRDKSSSKQFSLKFLARKEMWAYKKPESGLVLQFCSVPRATSMAGLSLCLLRVIYL